MRRSRRPASSPRSTEFRCSWDDGTLLPRISREMALQLWRAQWAERLMLSVGLQQSHAIDGLRAHHPIALMQNDCDSWGGLALDVRSNHTVVDKMILHPVRRHGPEHYISASVLQSSGTAVT
ncbi:hypothetical protein SKAU_G00028870 [Synaphobranchus kaupii]|uniref:Uncharacterized protein n=1 Tax=Synaphobranchus kaupii TaxID=118154 RepID=A0A9Q1JFS6_SYNKA|nr:hypothetical protein SKAU_G00028870 [Synaphobranchus kaupii]